jgi:hypothetical protein
MNDEFCIEQRFTPGGDVIKSACMALTKISGKDGCDAARESVTGELKGVGSFCWNEIGKVKLSYITPDMLPLKDKVTERIASRSLSIKFSDSAFVRKLNDARAGYQAPTIEAGKITTDPKDLYCRIMAVGGFADVGIPFEFSKDNTKDQNISGSRRLTFAAGVSGPFFIDAECFRSGDMTPFTVNDLKTIFGSLATIE